MRSKRLTLWITYGSLRDARMYLMSFPWRDWDAINLLSIRETEVLRELEAGEPNYNDTKES